MTAGHRRHTPPDAPTTIWPCPTHRLIGRTIAGRALFAALTLGLVSSTAAATTVLPKSPGKTALAGKLGVKANTEVDAAVANAMLFVEKTRKVKFRSRPKIEVLAPSEFAKRFDTDQSADPESKRDEQRFRENMRALGLVPAKADPQKLLDGLLDGSVLGYYEPKKKALVVRGGKITPLVRTILVHELTHALDDQHYDLDRPELSKGNTGADEAFQFLVEGTARWVENQYRKSLSKANRKQLDKEELAIGLTPDQLKLFLDPTYSRAVPFLMTLLLAPYEVGNSMIDDLVRSKGVGAIEEAFKNPPTTVEQAAHLAKYLSKEKELPVGRPPVDGGKTLDQGSFGQSALSALFISLQTLGDTTLQPEVDGWGGDRYVTFSKASNVCIRIDVRMDNETSKKRLEKGLQNWATEAPAASITNPTKDLIRLTSCSA
jgi:hypothetical protein